MSFADAPRTDGDIAAFARLLRGVEDGWHSWMGPDPSVDELQGYLDQNPTHGELLAKSFQAEMAYGSRGEILEVEFAHSRNENSDSVHWQTAISLLAQPLEIVVENERRDGWILKNMLSAVDEDFRDRVNLSPSPIRFVHGGGKAEAIGLIRHRVSVSQLRPRFFVVVDSDARFPGQMDADSNELLKLCNMHGFSLWLTKKRAIENYIDDNLLNEYAADVPDIAGSVEFILRLSPVQRDHYPIKAGLNSQDLGSQPQQTQTLFAGVALPQRRAALRRLIEFVCADTARIPDKADLASRGALVELEELSNEILERA